MVSQNFRFGIGDDWKSVTQDVADMLVDQLPPALEQALVSSFLDKRMLEGVGGFRWRPSTQEQFGLLELRQRRVQRQIIAPRHRPQ